MSKTKLQSGKIQFLILFIILFSLQVFADGTPPTGAGTSGDPYQIATLDNLLWLSTNDTSWSSYFIQTADIDASETSGWNSGAGFSPIGNYGTTSFTGNYDGQGYIIDAIYINRSSNTDQGLFGVTDGAGISNLGVTNIDVSGDDYVGGLVGYHSYSSITNSYSTGSVSGITSVGGLVGENSNSSTTNSYSTGSVSGTAGVGGLVGFNSSTPITNCYSTGSVSGTTNVGGLVGNNDSTVNNSFWDVENSGQSSSAGGTGKTTAEMQTESTYTDVGWDFINETTNGTDDYWGIDGYNNDYYPFLSWQKFLPTVTTTTASSITHSTAVSGGEVNNDGYLSVTARGVCWSTSANPTTADSYTTDGSGTGSFTSSITGLNFSTTYYYRAYATNSVGTSYGGEYTFITTCQGSGTFGDPYQINNLTALRWLSEHSASWSSYFIQTADIDASATTTWNSGAGFSPIGVDVGIHFSGSYNGQGYVIDSLFISRASSYYQGLFGILIQAEIFNLGVTNFDVSGDDYVGGLVGWNRNSSITNSYSTGSVSGDGYVGGLVGWNYPSTITNCYSTGSVSGDDFVGGLVGENSNSSITNSYSTGSVSGNGFLAGGLVGCNNSSSISNCYSTGSVSGNINIGGLVGDNYSSTISNCYSTGIVSGTTNVGGLVGDNDSTVNNSFWDTETSLMSSSEGGTGKTTAEMQDVATFTDLTTVGLDTAWDFVGNPNDDTGNDDNWMIDGLRYNDGYPYLTWQTEIILSNFFAAPTEVYIGTETQFNDYSLGHPNEWQWDFDNDGTYDSTEQNPVYTYSSSGLYSVKLTVSDGTNTDSYVRTDYITVSSEIAVFSATPVEQFIGTAVQFTDESHGNPIQWQWDFENDGTYDSTQQHPVHIYNDAGYYSVKLTVTNQYFTDSLLITDCIIVNSEPVPPQNVQINLSGDDAVISWDAVTHDDDGVPINLTGYVIKFSEDAEDYFFLQLIEQTYYRHEYVTMYSPQMFYNVMAVKHYSTRQLEYLKELNNSKDKIKWSEVKQNLERVK